MIDKSGIIPSGKQKGVPYSCRKGKVFKGREGAEERESISKECIVSGKLAFLRAMKGFIRLIVSKADKVSPC